jgi:hypothetical protein
MFKWDKDNAELKPCLLVMYCTEQSYDKLKRGETQVRRGEGERGEFKREEAKGKS